jgi:ribonuclease HII
MVRRRTSPVSFEPFEAAAREAGYHTVAGIDEAGRGPLAGPVVAAAVILPVDLSIPGLQDSKQLTERQRQLVYGNIVRYATSCGVGMASHRFIDQYNILQATQQAMCRAVRHLACLPDMLLIDGTVSIPSRIAQQTLVRGDTRCASIAAASIVAKVIRDRLMVAYAKHYPHYGFERHKGYPTAAHYAQLRSHGPCAIHRRSFRGVLTAIPSQRKV